MTVYLNGQFLAVEHAQVSVLDRGFIFGDGVYEVIPVYSRRAFRLSEHLQRLQHSCEGILLPNPHSENEWTVIVNALIARHSDDDQYLYLHVTRGAAPRDHAFPVPSVAPTVLVMSKPLTPPTQALLDKGVACITAVDNRWLRCDIKAISLLPNVLLRQQAIAAGCTESILIRDNEFMTEGAASNIFVVKNNILIAPPKDNLMLPGITYDVLLEIAAAHDIAHEVRRVAKAELFTADELLLTSSTREVLSITQLDGKPVANGKPGAMFTQLHTLYQSFKRNIMRKPSL
jgi:D-alanine transaminase